ncbi:MAG: hypothetical protein AB4080_18415 [Trichodesmium sp.]
MMIQLLSNSKFMQKFPIITALSSSLMIAIIAVSQAGGPPLGTTKPPTGKPVEVESEPTEPTRRQPPETNQQEDNSEPSGDMEKPTEVESQRNEPTRRQRPGANQQTEVESQRNEPTRRQPPTQESETTEPPPKFPEPAGRVTPGEGIITLRLINQTDAVINYQVIGGRYRTLGERSVVELSELPIPLTLTYQRPDGGLLLVSPQGISSRVLEVRFNATEDFSLDSKSLNISGKGGVFLN